MSGPEAGQINLQPAPALAVALFFATLAAHGAVLVSGLPEWLSVLILAGLWGHCLYLIINLIKPNKALFINNKKLYVRRLDGRLVAEINKPVGVAMPFFVGLRSGRLQTFGWFSCQMSPADFARISRWVQGGDA